ncbi:hypothetical protein RhiJN_16371 [Ceratobasidium sp. AG-Ba]|nr:hypothetical protein RhiJN_16371 [Ceratobasidium sp. AG-Ba]
MATTLSSDVLDSTDDSIYKSPKLWKMAHTTLEHDGSRAIDWLECAMRADDRILLYVENILQQDAQALEDFLYSKGYKPRFDWYDEKETAVFFRETIVGITVAQWMTQMSPHIEQELVKLSVCGRPSISIGGAGTTTIPGVGSYSPNQQYRVYLEFLKPDNEGHSTILHSIPRVVLEVIAGQPRELAMRKVWEYLYYTDWEVHAVIVLAASYPLPLDSTFKAVIEVWRREPDGDLELDFPEEDCDSFEHDVPASAQYPSGASDLPNLFGLPGPTSGENPTWADVYVPEGQTHRIVQHSASVVVLDESLGDQVKLDNLAEDFTLQLSTFDFLRLCSKRQGARPAAMTPIPLGRLKQDLVYMLKDHRYFAKNNR